MFFSSNVKSLHYKYWVSEIFTGPQMIPGLEKISANDTAKRSNGLDSICIFQKKLMRYLGEGLFIVSSEECWHKH